VGGVGVVVVVVVADGAVVVEVVEVVVDVVVLVTGGWLVVVEPGAWMGVVEQAPEASDPDSWSAGTEATAAPLRSRPTTVDPVRSAIPGTASTTTPELGAMSSTELPPELRWTEVTALPTQTATQPTGAASAVPKEPTPRSSTVSGEGGAEVGRGTDPVPTALSVDSSISSCPQVAVDGVGTVLMGPEPVEGVGAGPAVPTAPPDDATAPADVPASPVTPFCVCGTVTGCAQSAPCGHGVGAGTVPKGVQAAALVHPPVVLVVDR